MRWIRHARPWQTSSRPSFVTFARRFGGSASDSAYSVTRGPTGWRSATVGVLGAVAIALIAIALSPRLAFAWTPGTHVFLGEAVLR
jgi:hypothetical protein